MKPPLFKRGIDPMKVEAGVLGIEKLFEVFPCTEAQKVQLVAFTLEDKARRWKMAEFETLRQGNKTIAEYEEQFTELAHFAPHMMDTNYMKARKFEGGLRNAILDRINVLKLHTYIDMLERAIMAEDNITAQN
ncbi:uncharacterized protein LOC114305362 [Camellia sinensis]|uniref:uncharacterized protein LOC114305362 n=1 Tax=Camellia sinensis TaxID=4442 RepID=UPI001036EA12|nr:uncharacterized protein LOC114305362 [Camellia sinensis]